MTRPSRAVYAGSFDMPTKGHESVINYAADLFDDLIVGVAQNPTKKTMFTYKDRFSMLEGIAKNYKNVHITYMYIPAEQIEYTVDFADRMGADCLVRGLRNAEDFTAEQKMCEYNRMINPRIKTVFIMPEYKYSLISSSAVKGMMGIKGWEKAVRPYIPESIWDQFLQLAVPLMYNHHHGVITT